MDKFTNLKKISDKEKKKELSSILFENEYVKVKDYEGWTIIEESDCVVCIPILMDSNQSILREEYIPTFKKRTGNEMYITVLSGTIEKGESPEETLKRELKEEAGIILRDNLNITFENRLFMTKGNMSYYHLCLLPLYLNDFTETYASGDGSKAEKMSRTVKVNNYNLDNLIINDTITELMIMKLKNFIDI